MKAKKDPKITITLGGKDEKLTLSGFIKVIHETLDILNGVEKNKSGQDISKIVWEIVSVNKQSPLSMTLCGRSKEDSRITPKKVVADFGSAFRTVNRLARRPKVFDDILLQKAKNMTSLLRNGMEFIEFKMDDDLPIRLSSKIVDNLDKLTSKKCPYYNTQSCHEGILEIVDVHGRKPEFYIFDTITKEGIRCIFDSRIVKEIGAGITQKIRVYGETRYRRKDHKPISIKVSRYEIKKQKEDLPQMDDIHLCNINITQGQSSEDFIGELRDAE